ncbi:MAG: hypothetical protein A2293_14760 [Elusimicrobia bacterium RIFOXYB2_FULL_49_7]|nr:MAG: hypothetical protein A2293_14760 [Elusimicrobia bacterium RIFOXYB2_FULL_49_7]
MDKWVDASLYPDMDLPRDMTGLTDRMDFLARLCSAWDFGILPRNETVDEIRRPEWRSVVEVCNLPTSSAYHLVRRWHGLPPIPYLGDRFAYISEDENLIYV